MSNVPNDCGVTPSNTGQATSCTCTTTDTYRQLDRECPVHGDRAEQRRSGTDNEVRQLRDLFEGLSEELAALRESIAECVTTRRLVVVDAEGVPVIYSESYDNAVQLVVEHRGDRGGDRRHEFDDVAAVVLHAGHESSCDAGWNVSVDGNIAATAMAHADDRPTLGDRTDRVVRSYLELESGTAAAGDAGHTTERVVSVDPSIGVELRNGRDYGRMVARPRFEVVDVRSTS